MELGDMRQLERRGSALVSYQYKKWKIEKEGGAKMRKGNYVKCISWSGEAVLSYYTSTKNENQKKKVGEK